MYFPYLRGRQFELLALKELVENNLLCNKIIPIIEPVKASTTFYNTIATFKKKGSNLAIIINPKVGTYYTDLTGYKKKDLLISAINDKSIIQAIILDSNIAENINKLKNNGKVIPNSIIISNEIKYLPFYQNAAVTLSPLYDIILDDAAFRRTMRELGHKNKVMLRDPFPKKLRNADYPENENILLSADHRYFEEDGYIGYSDYSIVGNDYSDSGYAPHAIVLHITYLDSEQNLMLRHFKSKTNSDPSDPANKFGEALESFIEWDSTMNLQTRAAKLLHTMYNEGAYPGLGTIKKICIMQHLETMNEYFKG